MKKIKLYSVQYYNYKRTVYKFVLSRKSSNNLQFTTLCQIEEYLMWCIKHGMK